LLEDEYLNGLDIYVSTINEEVTLRGIVPNKNLGKRSESIAKNTNGVRKVTSKLSVE
jgi:osmotically-inducible protein OsmY